jgi:hypothetical protein
MSDTVVCIWQLWTGSEYSVWYCCMHLSYGQGASTVCDIVVCIWQLWTGSEYSVWYCCMHLSYGQGASTVSDTVVCIWIMDRERVQCVILLYAFDSYGQGACTVCDIVVCIWQLLTGSEYSVWYCCMHLTVINREPVQCVIFLYAFDSYKQGASTVRDIVVCIWQL